MATSTNRITILGASGFIGTHLTRKLKDLGIDVFAPGRDEELAGERLGDVIYCIGLTADFRSRPHETVEAHACKLIELLRRHDYESILYLSTTRVYRPGQVAREDVSLQVNPTDPDDLYNISKLMGESLLLSSTRNARIARISNVYGKDFTSQNFLSSLLKDSLTKGSIVLETSLDSEKDYVNIDDVVDGLLKIAGKGRHSIYNIAGGTNISHRSLVTTISELTGCKVRVTPDAPVMKMPLISIERMQSEFHYEPSSVLSDLEGLVQSYISHYGEGR